MKTHEERWSPTPLRTSQETPPADDPARPPHIFDRSEQRRLKREAVVGVAASAFNRRGFANTSMDDVAKALGVTKPTLYQYFSSKQDILNECHHRAMDHGEAGLALAAAHHGSAAEKLMVYLRRYMQGIFGDFGTCAVLTDVDSLTPQQRATVVERRSAISSATQDLIEQGIADSSIAPCDAKLATLFTLGAVNWIPLWYRETGPNTPDEIIDEYVRLLKSRAAQSPPDISVREPSVPTPSVQEPSMPAPPFGEEPFTLPLGGSKADRHCRQRSERDHYRCSQPRNVLALKYGGLRIVRRIFGSELAQRVNFGRLRSRVKA